jgi:hypothetical protein
MCRPPRYLDKASIKTIPDFAETNLRPGRKQS